MSWTSFNELFRGAKSTQYSTLPTERTLTVLKVNRCSASYHNLLGAGNPDSSVHCRRQHQGERVGLMTRLNTLAWDRSKWTSYCLRKRSAACCRLTKRTPPSRAEASWSNGVATCLEGRSRRTLDRGLCDAGTSVFWTPCRWRCC